MDEAAIAFGALLGGLLCIVVGMVGYAGCRRASLPPHAT